MWSNFLLEVYFDAEVKRFFEFCIPGKGNIYEIQSVSNMLSDGYELILAYNKIWLTLPSSYEKIYNKLHAHALEEFELKFSIEKEKFRKAENNKLLPYLKVYKKFNNYTLSKKLSLFKKKKSNKTIWYVLSLSPKHQLLGILDGNSNQIRTNCLLNKFVKNNKHIDKRKNLVAIDEVAANHKVTFFVTETSSINFFED